MADGPAGKQTLRIDSYPSTLPKNTESAALVIGGESYHLLGTTVDGLAHTVNETKTASCNHFSVTLAQGWGYRRQY